MQTSPEQLLEAIAQLSPPELEALVVQVALLHEEGLRMAETW